MTRSSGLLKAVSLTAGMVITSTATATTGYFALGYGAKAMGLAGAVVSNPQDSATIAVNPAAMTAVGQRVDVGLRFFSPIREAELKTSVLNAGANFGAPYEVNDESRRDLFLIPNFGFNLKLKDNLWFGLSNYGNGGMNSTYDRNLYDQAAAVFGAIQFGIPMPPAPAPVPAGPAAAASVPAGSTTPTPDTGTLGVDLAQAIFAPTLAMKVREQHSVGVSLLLGVQRFSARGLGNFQCFTSAAINPANGAACAPGGMQALTPGFVPSNGLTNNSSDWSYGAGARIGWLGEVHPRVTLGASVSSKIYMTELDDYDELFAEDGDFDIPANFTLGATFEATPKLKLSFDFQRILYEGVNSISNAGPVFDPDIGGSGIPGPNLPPGGGLLGTDNGLGFGWEDINIYRLAAEYAHSKQWIYRAGFSINDQPIPDDQVLFNILAPAVVEKHATIGFTYNPDAKSEWNFAYMHAFEEEVKTSQTAFGIPGSIQMYQNSVDLSYSYKF